MDELIKSAQKDEKQSLKSILKEISKKSGNTPAILQSSYIHPGLIDLGKTNDWDFVLSLRLCEKPLLVQGEKLFLAYLHTKHARDALAIDT